MAISDAPALIVVYLKYCVLLCCTADLHQQGAGIKTKGELTPA